MFPRPPAPCQCNGTRGARMRRFASMLIDRYVFRELLGPTLLGLLVYTTLFWAHRFFLLASKLTEGVFDLQDVGLALVYITPSILAQTLPMSTLVGVLIGFSRLSADAEITALRASGVSYFRLMVPTLALAALAWAACSAVYLKAVPWANQRFVELHAEAAQKTDLNREIEPGRWLSEGGAHIHARGLDLSQPSEPWLLDVDVVIGKKGETRREHVRAERARITRVRTAEDTTRLELVLQGMNEVMWDTSERHAFRSSSERYTRPLDDTRLPGLNGGKRRVMKQARSKTLGELRATLVELQQMDAIDALPPERAKEAAEARAALTTRWVIPQRRDRERSDTVLEIHKKFSIPFACVVFAIAGMPLGIATRRGGRPASFVISIGVVALWWITYQTCSAWMDVGRLSPLAAAWLPDVIILIVGGYMLLRTRRQQSTGLFRGVTAGFFMTAIVLLFLAAVLTLEKLHATAATPPVPSWLPIGGAAALALGVLMRVFRDPVSAAMARLAIPFRRPRDRDEGPEVEGHRQVARARPAALRSFLDRFRSALVFGLLALGVVCVLEVAQNADGPVAGLAQVLLSWEGPLLLIGLVLAAALQHAGFPVIPTIDGWVLGAYLRSFAAVLGSMIFLYAIIHYVDLADEILEFDPGWPVVGKYYLNLLARMLFETLPYAAMIAALVVFGVMTKFNETTALRCLGVSIFRLAAPVLLLGFTLSILSFVLHDYVLPEANVRAEALKDVIMGRTPRPRFETRGLTFARDNRTLYLYDQLAMTDDRMRSPAETSFINLTMIEPGPDGRTQRLVSAKAARWDGETWVLRAGWEAVFQSEEDVDLVPFEELKVARIEEPAYFASSRAEPNEMTFAEYKDYIADQTAAGYPTEGLQMHLQKKIAFPAAAFVLTLVGLPFAFKTGKKGALYGVGIALILAVTYYAVQALFAALGDNAQLPAVVAAWAPNALFGAAGVYMLLGVRT